MNKLTRKQVLKGMLLAAAAPAMPGIATAQQRQAINSDITLDDLKSLEKMAGIEFTDEEREAALGSVRNFRSSYESIRELGIENSVSPPVAYKPLGRQPDDSRAMSCQHRDMPGIEKPMNDEDVAFMTVAELSQLVKQKKISPVELTEIYLARIDSYGEKLLNVITPLHDLAREQAKRAEKEIMSGDYRGPLHGIPFGIKDLFSVKGHPTTWGSEPHVDQVFDYDAAVVEMLEEAGAVCLAKLSMGALAMNDHWHKGRTKNPWDPSRGSSGSSAGPGSAMAAGLVAFSIGTETQGSIISPSHRCRVTGLRPSFGRVSRAGAMVLSWSMDKAGPMCRTAEDCMLVLTAINGSDVRDPSSVDKPLHWTPDFDIKSLNIGVLSDAEALGEFDGDVENEDYLRLLRDMGATLKPVKFSQPPRGIQIDLSVECAAAFDDFTRGDEIDELQNSGWPGIFRAHRYVTGVEYMQVMRARTLMMQKYEEELSDLDLVMAPGRGSFLLFITNRSGHPQISVPNGSNDRDFERSFSIYGRLYDETTMCQVAWAMQQEMGHHRKRPDLSGL